MPYLSTDGLTLRGILATDPFQPASGSLALGALETTDIPVDLSSSSFRTLYRVVTGPVQPGDALDIDADARVTNNCGYNIGVAWHLWIYDYDNPLKTAGPWTRIGAFSGENVTPDMHHMFLHISTFYRMPADWPPGHRPVVVMRADAHSTAWQAGDTLDVDAGYGQMIVRHWAPPPAV